MEVDHTHFWPKLLPLLRSIANAAFVTIDLEMSGISTRKRDRGSNIAKPTLQEQYEETKEAAEKFQILQIGITCIEEDRERYMYVARPYNFNLSPLFLDGDKLDIERSITLSTSAIMFLMRNKFDVGAVFTRGITYLSKHEENQARRSYLDKQDRSASIGDISISPNDSEALNFYRKARQTISSFAKQKEQEIDYVNIGAPNGGLNGFQRRLIHQLVRSEFKGYRAFSRRNGEFMQIEKIDHVKEEKIAQSNLLAFEARLAKQAGFKFVFDALSGGDLKNIDPKWFCINEYGEPALTNLEAKKAELDELKQDLKKSNRVLVGHNLFTDLMFLHQTFVGPLPEKVEDFQKTMHDLFPHVFDTKYLATHEGSSMRTNSRLDELYQASKSQEKPFIVLAEQHMSYAAGDKDHEAGYDSLMTAHVFAKLATKLRADGPDTVGSETDDDLEYESAKESFGADYQDEFLNPPDTNMDPQPIRHQNLLSSSKKAGSRGPTMRSSRFKKLKQNSNSQVTGSNRFNLLEDEGDDSDSEPGGVPINLMDEDMDDGFRRLSNAKKELRPQAPGFRPRPSEGSIDGVPLGISPEWHAAQLNPHKMPNIAPDGSLPKQWVPSIRSSFWDPYANKLRVYGTDAGICDLGSYS